MRLEYTRVETVEKPVTERGGLVHARERRTMTTVADSGGVRTTTEVRTFDRHCPAAGRWAGIAFIAVSLVVFLWATPCLAATLVVALALPAYRIVGRLEEAEPDLFTDVVVAVVAGAGLLAAWWLCSTFPGITEAHIKAPDLAIGRDRTKEQRR